MRCSPNRTSVCRTRARAGTGDAGPGIIGIAAPALLVLFRLLQGFSAGGEMGGASVFVAEYAPPKRRGFYVSWVEMGCIVGFLLGSVVALILNLSLSDDELLSWGWRIPFLLAGPLVVRRIVGYGRLDRWTGNSG